MFWAKAWKSERTLISGNYKQFNMTGACIKIRLEIGRCQMIMGPHCSSFLVLISFFWVQHVRIIRMFHLNSPVLPVETFLPIWIHPGWSYSLLWPDVMPASASFLSQSSHCSLYWQVKIFATGTFDIWMDIWNPVYPGLIFSQYYFHQVIITAQ